MSGKPAYDKIFEEELLPQINALSTFAFHLTYNEADADDLVQETYLKAYRFIDKYEPGTNPKAWLFRILKNGFINEYRKSSRTPTNVDFEDVIAFQDKDDASYVQNVDLRSEMYEDLMGDEVTMALNAIPLDFREVILLCDIEGFSYEEISDIIEIPIGTVRSRLFRARNLLKQKLKTYAESLGFKDYREKNKHNG